ncbi:4Fe-4S dicluster domain-containing protein [Tropicimonas sediminicola]|uniref:4Fe-4S dicluster containing protein n=1 Tax=Tropicimonas sediminicola TaxID=1031541 RepID=A0A239JZ52_9RHOB|nr:4Fe-4S dicluster domain-containing protein [Tropicimonas sediminicola]SNT10114.1 4Fe-4S dicluster containing protein [Tropicimonas sediminicola]
MAFQAHAIIDSPAPLVAALKDAGWKVIAPVERDGALVLAAIQSAEELPRGRVDRASPGEVRIEDGRPGRWFDHTLPASGWKRWLHPPRHLLWRANRGRDGFELKTPPPETEDLAFLGIRPCDLAAIARLDAVLGPDGSADTEYMRRRRHMLSVVVQCARAADTCFCTGPGTGPRAEHGFDLALTELEIGLLVEVGSERGAGILERLPSREARETDIEEAHAISRKTAGMQRRRLPPSAAAAIAQAPDHPEWDQLAARCLACGNCTLVCPTCFCTDVEDTTDLSGDHAERWQVWDSCFATGFSFVHEGPVRTSVRSRYRQWLTHKLATWYDQYGTSGCIGCGRCIAWCPVGIDLTAAAEAIARPASPSPAPTGG